MIIYTVKQLIEMRGRKAELEKEIAGKRSVLNGAFLGVKKGDPHWKQKRFIKENLVKDTDELAKIDSALKNSIPKMAA